LKECSDMIIKRYLYRGIIFSRSYLKKLSEIFVYEKFVAEIWVVAKKYRRRTNFSKRPSWPRTCSEKNVETAFVSSAIFLHRTRIRSVFAKRGSRKLRMRECIDRGWKTREKLFSPIRANLVHGHARRGNISVCQRFLVSAHKREINQQTNSIRC